MAGEVVAPPAGRRARVAPAGGVGELLARAAARRRTGRGSARRAAPCSAASARSPPPTRRRTRPRRRAWSAWLKRRSNPIVEDAFELIALPQSEPATWPGKTSTPSGSSSRRRSDRKRPFAPSLGADREVGPSGVADEERVAREHEPRLVGARAIDDGEARVLGPVARRVDRPQDDAAELELEAVARARRADTPPRRPGGSRSARRARARAGRDRRGGRRGCASRHAHDPTPRRAASRAPARARTEGRRSRRRPRPRHRRDTTRSRDRRRETAGRARLSTLPRLSGAAATSSATAATAAREARPERGDARRERARSAEPAGTTVTTRRTRTSRRRNPPAASSGRPGGTASHGRGHSSASRGRTARQEAAELTDAVAAHREARGGSPARAPAARRPARLAAGSTSRAAPPGGRARRRGQQGRGRRLRVAPRSKEDVRTRFAFGSGKPGKDYGATGSARK